MNDIIKTNTDSDLVLFSTGCPKCTILKKKLDSKNIKYEVTDNLEPLVENHIMSIPVLYKRSEDKYMTFADAVAFVNNY
jgi:hypothetical protein